MLHSGHFLIGTEEIYKQNLLEKLYIPFSLSLTSTLCCKARPHSAENKKQYIRGLDNLAVLNIHRSFFFSAIHHIMWGKNTPFIIRLCPFLPHISANCLVTGTSLENHTSQ